MVTLVGHKRRLSGREWMGWLGLYSKKFGFYLVESSLKKSLA